MRLRNGLLTGMVVAGVVWGAPSAWADLPNDIRTSQNASSQASAITNYVEALVKTIRGPDAKAASDARRELCEQVENRPGGPQVAAGFQLTYAGIVVNAIQPMLKSPEVADRLNAAIIVYRLCNATKLPSLQPAVQTLLADESEAVALWGVKSAGTLIPSVLSTGFTSNNEKLTTGILEAVKKHPESGPIIQDAYKALDVSGVSGLPLAGVAKAAEAMNQLLAFRIQLYIKGIPVDIHADRDPTLFLWKVVSSNDPELAKKSVQNLINLLAVTAQRFVETPGGEVKDRLKRVCESAAASLIVIFQTLQTPGPIAAFNPFKSIGIINATQLSSMLQNAVAETRKVSLFAEIKDPPSVEPAQARVN